MRMTQSGEYQTTWIACGKFPSLSIPFGKYIYTYAYLSITEGVRMAEYPTTPPLEVNSIHAAGHAVPSK